jgi:cysteine-rich repeat protein
MMQTCLHLRHTRSVAGSVLAACLGGLLAATPVAAQCAGDCDGNGMVTINELIVGVNIALGSAASAACAAIDRNSDGMVTISELIAAVNSALAGCTPTTPQASPTATPTHTSQGGTPTVTATAPANCGNGSVEASQGETCDDGNRSEGPGDTCPANCRILTCPQSGQTLTVDVVFDTTPADLLVAGMTLFIRYPDGSVDVPGANNDPPVQAAVTSEVFSITPNDQNFALTAVLIDPFFLGVTEGTAIRVDFNICAGMTAPPLGAFNCRVTDATDVNLDSVTDQVTCHLVLP